MKLTMVSVKTFCLIIFFMVSNAFSMELDVPDFRRPVPCSFTHSLLGVSTPVPGRFYSLCPGYQRDYFDTTDLYGGGRTGVLHSGEFFYKKDGHRLSILFIEDFSISRCDFSRVSSLRFANLITHAFSQSGVEEVNIYTSLHSEHVVSHAQFMEMQCTRDRTINVRLKTVDSLSLRNMQSKDRKIRALFADPAFSSREILLSEISHVPLGIQSCISFDCNVFTTAFLYIKATTDTDPEHVRNHRALFKTMQSMVTTGAVQSLPTKTLDILGHATNLICYLSKRIDAVERYEHAHPSRMPIRFCKLGACKVATFAMKATVSIARFVFSRIVRE